MVRGHKYFIGFFWLPYNSHFLIADPGIEEDDIQ